LDSGGVNIDYLLIANYEGINIFNGVYNPGVYSPGNPLTWKIEDYWRNQDFTNYYGRLQMVNAVIQREIMCVLPNRRLLVGNYSNGLDSKNIRWATWSFLTEVNTVAIQNIKDIILGCDVLKLGV
jgi:hypothetical protein